jgi:5-methylcytosine-specific restriction endonuclease McrA
MLRTSPSYLRSEVLKRDQGICAICGLDTLAIEAELTRLYWESHKTWPCGKEMERFKKSLGISKTRKSLWDADHILPVHQGGGECGLENMQTLCIWCHKKKTKVENK